MIGKWKWVFVAALALPLAGASADEQAPAEEAPQTTASEQTPPVTPGLEVRARAMFEMGDYANALPLLESLARQFADEPDRLGPVQEMLRATRRNLESGNNRPAGRGGAQPARTPHTRPADGQILEITIQQLGNFDYDMDNGGNVPADVMALNGATVRLRGFMIPIDQATNIRQFALVPDLMACCFGQPPQLHHTVIVNTPASRAVAYFPEEIVVEGTLKVEEKWEDGMIMSLFEVACTSVRPAAR